MYLIIRKAFVIIVFILSGISIASAQSVRSLNNSGVDAYKNQQFADAEVNFKKGLEKSNESFELNYNLGDSYYKQQRYGEAVSAFQSALTLTEDNNLKAKAYHNIGNSLLKDQKIEESIEAYKNSLKLDPQDQETKYNLSYALELLKQKQNQNKNDQNQINQDQKDNKDQNKQDQQKDNKQDQQDKNQNNQSENQKQNKDQEAKQDNLKQQEKDKISKEEAERILEALKNNEKDLQKKLRKKAGASVKTDKDW